MTAWNRIVSLRDRLSAKMDVVFVAGGYSWDNPKFQSLQSQYGRCVQMLAAMSPDMACWEIDPQLWDNYSDSYKEECGVRPRSGSYAEVRAFIDRRIRQTRLHEGGECDLFCYICHMKDQSALEEQWRFDQARRMEAEERLAAALADDAPEFLDVPVYSGRGRNDIHLLKHLSHNARVISALRATENRGRRSRQRAVLGQALKTQCFDIAC